MDTLFKLVNFQQPHPQQQQQQQSDQISFNNSTSRTNSSISSRSSSKQTHHNYYQQQQQQPHYPNHHHHHQEEEVEECFNIFMDNEEDFSSSSSYNKHHHLSSTTSSYYPNYTTTTTTHHHHYSSNPSTTTSTPTPTNTSTTTTPPHHGGGGGGGAADLSLEFSSFSGNWASNILLETARAFSDGNTSRLHQLLWMLNELGSPYGDVEQKLSSYFTQALFNRMNDSGSHCYTTMRAAAEKTFSFESTRKMVLKFQEVSPWTTFGHVACNGALMDAMEGEQKLHIIDINTTFCTQWPTLLEALATRMDETPHLKLTTVVVNKPSGGEDGGATAAGGGVQRVMREVGCRLEKFARLMGVPFKFNVIHHEGDLSDLDFSELDIKDDEALAINCVNSLHSVNVHCRDSVLSTFRRLHPRVVTVVEEEADLVSASDDVVVGSSSDDDGYTTSYEFLRGFGESLRWFRVYFESLEECFPKTSNEKLMLERAAGRALVDLLARPEAHSAERRETAARWSARMRRAGFSHVAFSDEVSDDVRALLRRYKEGWSMAQCPPPPGEQGGGAAAGIFLSWRDQPVVWASAWKP